MSRAKRDMARLDPDDRDRIMKGIRRFAETGHGDVRRLEGMEGGVRRLRIGDWRVIYRLVEEEDAIEIDAIVHRSQAYRTREDAAPYRSERVTGAKS